VSVLVSHAGVSEELLDCYAGGNANEPWLQACIADDLPDGSITAARRQTSLCLGVHGGKGAFR
jgi:hypothetical protein